MEVKEIKKKLKKAFSKVVVMTCGVCGKFINQDEYKKGDGACMECWSK